MVPLAVAGDDHYPPRDDRLPQLDKPSLGLSETVKEVYQDQVIPFQLVRHPGHLEGRGVVIT